MKICFCLLLCLASVYIGAQTSFDDDPCASSGSVRTITLDPEPVGRFLKVPAEGASPKEIALYGPAGSEVTSLLRLATAEAGGPAYDLQLLPPGIYYLESSAGIRTLVKE